MYGYIWENRAFNVEKFTYLVLLSQILAVINKTDTRVKPPIYLTFVWTHIQTHARTDTQSLILLLVKLFHTHTHDTYVKVMRYVYKTRVTLKTCNNWINEQKGLFLPRIFYRFKNLHRITAIFCIIATTTRRQHTGND